MFGPALLRKHSLRVAAATPSSTERSSYVCRSDRHGSPRRKHTEGDGCPEKEWLGLTCNHNEETAPDPCHQIGATREARAEEPSPRLRRRSHHDLRGSRGVLYRTDH